MKTVGLLSIQGDYERHGKAFARAGAATRHVLEPGDLAGLDALLIPGGESTTMAKGLHRLGMYGPIREAVAEGLPTLGTCAGAILLSRESRNHPVETLGCLDALATRNAYGTQVDSFIDPVDDGAHDSFTHLRCVFIRAPQLSDLGSSVEVLARVGGAPVLVRERNVLAATFHPELTDDLSVQEALLAM